MNGCMAERCQCLPLPSCLHRAACPILAASLSAGFLRQLAQYSKSPALSASGSAPCDCSPVACDCSPVEQALMPVASAELSPLLLTQ